MLDCWLDATNNKEHKLLESILLHFQQRLLAQQEKEKCAIQSFD